jgi:secreted trypsin-like serine protease
VLYQAQGHILEDNACINVPEGYPDTNFNPENNICAGYNQASGDSGGPLMYRVNNSYVEVGLVSRRLVDAGQYTRIGFFRSWMDTIMSVGKCNQPDLLANGVSVCCLSPF